METVNSHIPDQDFFPEISNAKAVLEGDEAIRIFQELMDRTDWRIYISGLQPDVPRLCKRFYRSHALIPSVFAQGNETAAFMPLSSFRHTTENGTLEGFLYLNGAIVKDYKDSHRFLYLFVDENTAQRWSYPTDWRAERAYLADRDLL